MSLTALSLREMRAAQRLLPTKRCLARPLRRIPGHQQRERCARFNSAMKSFILSRLRGDAPLHTVFWRDMVVIGTGVNVLCTAAAFILLVAEAPWPWPLIAHMLPQPWNLFVFFAVWRSASQIDGQSQNLVRLSAIGWLTLMLIV